MNLKMKKTLKEQIIALRDSGKTNMLDSYMVQRIANEMGFYELVIFVEENRANYGKFFLQVMQNYLSND